MTNTIQLSDQTINELTSLCQIVLRKNPTNEISANMATGISHYMTTNRVVTEKQAHWLARNLDFYKIERPVELAHITIQRNGSVTTPSVASSSPPITRDAFQSQVLIHLSRIE